MSNESARMFTAQAAIRAGKKQQARDLLHEELEHNPQNFRAWLWLAGLAESVQDSLKFVHEAEQLNPHDPGVHKARAWAEQRLALQKQTRLAAVEVPDGTQELTTASHPGTEDETSQRVDALRDQKRAATRKTAPRRRRRFILAGLLLLIAAAILSALQWGNAAIEMALGAAPASEVASAGETRSPTATPQSTALSSVADSVALHFVSGKFAPQESVALPSDSDDVEPTSDATADATDTPVAMEPKPVNDSENEPRPTWTLTPSPTFTPTATPTPAPTFVSEEQVVVGGAVRPAGVGPNERWIDVNLTTQRLVAYEGDNAVFNSLVSSGTWMHPTVTGEFRVWLRYTAQTMDGRRLGYDYYLTNVPFVMYFYRDYALHGTYWHNNFGTPMSHGCVNLPTPAAEWIFNWSTIGTLVNVHY